MTLNFGLIRNQPSYEGGNTNIWNKKDFLETGEYSELTGNPIGAITSIYLNDITTGYRIKDNAGTTDRWVKWKFDNRIKFKNIYAYIKGNDGGQSGANTIRLQGSDDDSSWTDLDTVTISGAATKYEQLLATNVKYKYIRVITTDSTGDGGFVEILYMQSIT